MSEKKHPWEGQIVDGKFELRSYLGASDNGAVFATERDGQNAAIKIVRLSGDAAEKQLGIWARAGNLSHPNALPLSASGRCRIGGGDAIYVVMERADEALAEILPQRTLTAAEASEMLPPILAGLEFLHGKGLCHGRIKPSNILAVGDHVKISSDSASAAGTRAGVASAYDAPEAAATGYSTAADSWALGVTLIEALTQQNPARSAIGIVPGTLPQPFRDIAEHCVQRDPKTRWTIADITNRMSPEWREPQPQAKTKPQAAVAPAQRPSPAPKLQAPVPVAKTPVSRPAQIPTGLRKPKTKWRAFVPAAVIVLVAVIAIIVAPKFLNRSQSRQSEADSLPSAAPANNNQITTAAPSQPKADAVPAEKPESPPTVASDNAAVPQPNSPAATPAAAPAEITAPAPVEKIAPELSKPSAGGDVLTRVIPNVPQKALDTIHGTVKISVRVQIDASGNVSDASFESEGPSHYFANLAMKSAREWKFTPAGASRESILHFQITPAGTRVTETPAHP